MILRQFSLLATCQGGPIAIEYAARHPERVSRLILYGTYALGRLRWHDRPKEVEKARVLLDLTRLGWGQENSAFLQVWASAFQPGGTLDHRRSWCDQQCAATSAETAVRLLQIGWNVDVREAARKIKCPVLIVHPERDAVVPIEEGRLLPTRNAEHRFDAAPSEGVDPFFARSNRASIGTCGLANRRGRPHIHRAKSSCSSASFGLGTIQRASWPVMDKQPLTKEEIERLIVADLQTFAGCRKACAVVVAPVMDASSAATWTVLRFHTGGADGEACDRALQHIVPLFQRIYDLVRKH